MVVVVGVVVVICRLGFPEDICWSILPPLQSFPCIWSPTHVVVVVFFPSTRWWYSSCPDRPIELAWYTFFFNFRTIRFFFSRVNFYHLKRFRRICLEAIRVFPIVSTLNLRCFLLRRTTLFVSFVLFRMSCFSLRPNSPPNVGSLPYLPNLSPLWNYRLPPFNSLSLSLSLLQRNNYEKMKKKWNAPGV